MSSVEEKNLKAGHAPAVKAGGMRITQHRKTSESEKAPEMTPEEVEEYGEDSPPKDKTGPVIAGVVTKEKEIRDFPAEAVKSSHDKPQPAKEKPHKQPQHNINQPR